MVKKQNPNLLCKLGLHKWRDYGEKVVVTWKEPAPVKGGYGESGDWLPMRTRELPEPIHRQKEVFTKRKCLRCGIGWKRRLVNNSDGTLSCVGWDLILESEYGKDEYQAR